LTLGKPEVVYTVVLNGRGTPAGAPTGRGYAIIALHHQSILCFRFAHLHGFTIATKAVLYTGARPDRSSLYLAPGPRLHHQGCVRLTPATWSAVHMHATAYTVEIDSAKYLAGAVRARL
jgi:hypothetical protein